MDDKQFELAVWARLLSRGDKRLPPLVKDESPSDLFVGVVEQFPGSEVAERLRKVSVHFLRESANKIADRPNVIAELCYLAAATEATDAFPSLISLAESSSASAERLPSGQMLNVFAFRCVLGMLHALRDQVKTDEAFRRFLVKMLDDRSTQTYALTALGGLWPESLQDYVQRVPGADIRRIKSAMEVAGLA